MKKSLQAKDYDALGAFRYAMRKFLRFSKKVLAARANLTPEQYEALLAIKSSSGADAVTVGEISERLQVKHHTAVSLLDKLEAQKLATRKRAAAEPGPSMFPSEIKDWANGNNAARINLLVRHVVMPLDVIEVHRLGNAIMLV